MTNPESQPRRLSAQRRSFAAAWTVVLLVLGFALGLNTAPADRAPQGDGALCAGTVRLSPDPRPRSAIQQRAPVAPVADRTGPATDPSGPPRLNPKQATLAAGADPALRQPDAPGAIQHPAQALRQAGPTPGAPRGPPRAPRTALR